LRERPRIEHVRRFEPTATCLADAEALAPEGVFMKSSTHPRAYGNFVRVLGKYVRDEHVLTLQDAVRKLSGLPAALSYSMRLGRPGSAFGLWNAFGLTAWVAVGFMILGWVPAFGTWVNQQRKLRGERR
jgi:hypothetical protein